MNDMQALDTAAEPWIRLAELAHAQDAAGVAAHLDGMPPWEQARAMSRLSEADRNATLGLLAPERAADLVEIVSVTQAVDMIDSMEPRQAAAIVEQMRSDIQADVLAEMRPHEAEAILGLLDPREAAKARRLAEYPPDSAGGVMVTEYLAYYHSLNVADVLDDLRRNAEKYQDYRVQYAYVVDTQGRLRGVLRLRELLFSPKERSLDEVMLGEPLSLNHTAPLDELRQFFKAHNFFGVPVVDDEQRLVGVVERSIMERAVQQQATSMFMKISGIIGGEELRTMPVYVRSGRRLSWLSINIGLNIIAASVIAMYTDTLEAAIALAIFLPMISDMSGCSGNQSVAVSMRELTLGLAKPRDTLRVLFKEGAVGIINGIVLGVLLGGIAMIWKGNPWLGLVVGAALACNTVIAVCLGGTLPLILKKLKLDPAMVSGPILTTVTDMCGFFFVLSFAQAILSRLVTA